MNVAQHRPGPPLDQFVEFFWYHDGYVPAHRTERVLPTGTFELIINLRDEPRHTFDPGSLRPRKSYRKAWISGVQSEFLVIDTAPDASMMGVHFKPGGAAPFLGFPAGELAQRIEELDTIWGSAGARLREQLLDAPNPNAKFRVLAGFLARRLQREAIPNPAVQLALARFQAEPQTSTVENVLGGMGMSHRHFIELFRQAVGLTPKRFCRIQRFQQVLHDLEKQREIQWADVAYAGGFYDQAHFINEFKAFCGLSPRRYLKERTDHLNFVPIN